MIDLDEIRRLLGEGPPLRLAILFGSHATGSARPDSDVDIAILPLDPDLALGDENLLCASLASVLRRNVDLVRLDRASTFLRWQIARDGVPIFARSPVELIRFQAVAASEHAEFHEPMRRAGELFRQRLARPA